MINDEILRGEFETTHSVVKSLMYKIELALGNLLFKRSPPFGSSPRLLNLGCGLIKYPGWCNADEYGFKRWLREKQFSPDCRLDITKKWKCDDDVWDGIFCQHVIEHVRYSQADFVLRECFRTMKSGAYLRVSVPDVQKYVEFYTGSDSPVEYKHFPSKALAFSNIAQMHYHKSIWDGQLMKSVLHGIGFVNVCEFNFGEGHDQRIMKDQKVKAWESLYVEAQKPA